MSREIDAIFFCRRLSEILYCNLTRIINLHYSTKDKIELMAATKVALKDVEEMNEDQKKEWIIKR